MAYTNNQTATQLAAALVSAGMAQDAANNAVWTLAWASNGSGNQGQAVTIWGVLCKCTTLATNGGAPVFSYDATPA